MIPPRNPRHILSLALVAAAVLVGLAGCNGVVLNPTYSQLLDQTSALSAETASRAKAGQLTPDQMAAALDGQSQTWQMFRDARDGKNSATTQP